MCVSENTLRGTIVGKKHDIGDYTTYVFDVGGEEPYVMCTELPCWNLGPLDIGTVGFFKFREVAAGDEYVTKDGEICKYKHDGVYLLEFIKDNKSHGRLEECQSDSNELRERRTRRRATRSRGEAFCNRNTCSPDMDGAKD